MTDQGELATQVTNFTLPDNLRERLTIRKQMEMFGSLSMERLSLLT
jgi:hypothetical protein